MVEFFCPHCKQNTLDSFAVGFAHNRVLKCDFCVNKFRVSIAATQHNVQRTALQVRILNAICYGVTAGSLFWLLFANR